MAERKRGNIESWANASNWKYISLQVTRQRYTGTGWRDVVTYSSSGNGNAAIKRIYTLTGSAEYRIRSVAKTNADVSIKYSNTVRYESV